MIPSGPAEGFSRSTEAGVGEPYSAAPAARLWLKRGGTCVGKGNILEGALFFHLAMVVGPRKVMQKARDFSFDSPLIFLTCSLEAQSRAAAGGRLLLRASHSRQGVDSLQLRVGEQWGDIQLRVR